MKVSGDVEVKFHPSLPSLLDWVTWSALCHGWHTPTKTPTILLNVWECVWAPDPLWMLWRTRKSVIPARNQNTIPWLLTCDLAITPNKSRSTYHYFKQSSMLCISSSVIYCVCLVEGSCFHECGWLQAQSFQGRCPPPPLQESHCILYSVAILTLLESSNVLTSTTFRLET